MRVVHFREAFSLLTETFIHDSVVEMERQGADCRVLTLRRVNEADRPFDKVTVVPTPPRWNPARLMHKAASLWNGETRQTYARPLFRPLLRDALRRLRPDVVHAHFGPDAALIAPAARELGVPMVATFYGYDFSVGRVLDRWKREYLDLFDYADCCIGVSNHACDRLVELGAPRSRVALVRLGVRGGSPPDLDPGRRLAGGEVRCIHVGRLVPKKSPLDLLEAFHAAVAEVGAGVDLSLTIVGDGPMAPEVRRRAGELGLTGRVHLLGALPHARVLELLGRSHIYTQHSVTGPDGDQEGQPVSLVEAAATGLPIVSTLHSGIPEVVIDGATGYLVPEHDAEGMGARIADLARDPALRSRLGDEGRSHIERHFSLEAETARALSILEAAADRRAGRPAADAVADLANLVSTGGPR